MILYVLFFTVFLMVSFVVIVGLLKVSANKVQPIPIITSCPVCDKQHLDTGEWATRPHKTHMCVNDKFGIGCGAQWRIADVPTVGVEKLESSKGKPE